VRGVAQGRPGQANLKSVRGEPIIRKARIQHGPKLGTKGFVDTQGRIWIKDRAHAGDPDHWDVQEEGGRTYFRVDFDGNKLDEDP